MYTNYCLFDYDCFHDSFIYSFIDLVSLLNLIYHKKKFIIYYQPNNLLVKLFFMKLKLLCKSIAYQVDTLMCILWRILCIIMDMLNKWNIIKHELEICVCRNFNLRETHKLIAYLELLVPFSDSILFMNISEIFWIRKKQVIWGLL